MAGESWKSHKVTTRARDIVRDTEQAVAEFYFDNRPELRTSYSNQRQLAERDLGGNVRCIHAVTLADGCGICRASGTPLVRV